MARRLATEGIGAKECAELFDYDPETGILLWRHRPVGAFNRPGAHAIWTAQHAGKPVTGTPQRGYLCVKVKGRNYRQHRVAWAVVHGRWPGLIDHINGDRTDNRLANLRDVSFVENSKNRVANRDKRTPMGVSWCKQTHKWRAIITVNGRFTDLGRYPDMEQACAARKAAEGRHGFSPRHWGRR